MLEILINCARADLDFNLALAEQTGEVRYQHEAAKAREQLEALQALARVPA